MITITMMINDNYDGNTDYDDYETQYLIQQVHLPTTYISSFSNLSAWNNMKPFTQLTMATNHSSKATSSITRFRGDLVPWITVPMQVLLSSRQGDLLLISPCFLFLACASDGTGWTGWCWLIELIIMAMLIVLLMTIEGHATGCPGSWWGQSFYTHFIMAD